MSSRPVIFISAVSRELHTTRDLVAKTLVALGYEPKWQDIAPTETGDLRAILRKWIDSSHAVLQIVGHRYGYAPDQPDETFGSVSYTQYEALYARAKGKKVWYIIVDENHPIDCEDNEPDDLKNLQADYRIQVKAHHGLFHPSASHLNTENVVLKLRDDLAKLRRRSKQWAGALLAMLGITLFAVSWSLLEQKKSNEAVTDIKKQAADIDSKADALLAALRELPNARNEAKQSASQDEQDDDAALTTRAYADLEKSLKIPPGTLAKELPSFAKQILTNSDTSEIDQAKAAYSLRKYAEAETFALIAKEKSLAASPPRLNDVIMALRLAGDSAASEIQYKRALEHYRAAAAFTSESRDILEWAEVQKYIGWHLFLLGDYDETEQLMQSVWQICEKAGQQENPTTSFIRYIWANALHAKGHYIEAEKEFRAVLSIQQRIFGEEHPEVLKTRGRISNTLNSQGRYSEAEAEYLTILNIKKRNLQPEHPDLLRLRADLAVCLYYGGHYAEAQKEYKEILAIRERIFEPEDSDTLSIRTNAALNLVALDKAVEAEREYRTVISIRERVLGAEHPLTLNVRLLLASSINDQGLSEQAEKEYRELLPLQKRVRGTEHPETLSTWMGLATCLHSEGKFQEAEKEYRAVLSLQQRVCGLDHPDTLQSSYNLSLTLGKLGETEEALKFAKRALDGRMRIYGPDHTRTKSSKDNVEWLESL